MISVKCEKASTSMYIGPILIDVRGNIFRFATNHLSLAVQSILYTEKRHIVKLANICDGEERLRRWLSPCIGNKSHPTPGVILGRDGLTL